MLSNDSNGSGVSISGMSLSYQTPTPWMLCPSIICAGVAPVVNGAASPGSL